MKTTRDYYTVSIPGDCFDNLRDAAHYAIDEARERAKLFCVPAHWHAELVKGKIGESFELVFRVRRTRNARARS